MAKSNVIDLTGLTYEQAERYAKEKGKRIAHVDWPKGEHCYYDTARRFMVKVKSVGQLDDWFPSVGERYSGCGWACLED